MCLDPFCPFPLPAYSPLPRPFRKGTIPSGLSSLGALEWLNLSENVLTGPVPGSLSSLSRLVELNLSANRLTGPLPPELCGMTSLVCLQLSKNDLEGFLPAEVCVIQPAGLVLLTPDVSVHFFVCWPGNALDSNCAHTQEITLSSWPTHRSLAPDREGYSKRRSSVLRSPRFEPQPGCSLS